jgi:DNA-binding response OmpR family regulator
MLNGSMESLPPHSISVLLVEDDLEHATELVEFLRAHGVVVRLAGTGAEATQIIATETFDVIVVEMMLPGASGFVISQFVRVNCTAETVLIMISQLDAKELREYASLVGVNWYLAKPFTPSELLSDIQTLTTCRA